MKPKFIFSTGFGWCATTPLFYTLTISNEVVSPGLTKEDSYLSQFDYNRRERFERDMRLKKSGCLTDRQKYENKRKRYKDKLSKKYGKTSRKYGTSSTGGIKWESTRHLFFTQEEVDEYYSPPYTMDKYISYYRKHWDYMQENNLPHLGVCDFSNVNGSLTEKLIDEAVTALSEHFEVIALNIVRDPIRREWSESCCVANSLSSSSWESREQHLQYYYQKIKRPKRYLDVIDRWSKYVPMHVVVMEQLWEGDQQEREVSRLSNHVGFDIKEVHPNVYSPDCGTNPPHIPGLVDQWISDNFRLYDDIYYKSMPFFQSEYDAWEERFGSLPLYWGKPYPYPVEQPEIASIGLMKGHVNLQCNVDKEIFRNEV